MANTLLVGYDLKKGQDYEDLITYLKSTGTYWHHLDSTWFVVTSLSPSELRDEIKRHVNSDDEVLVMDVKGDGWASFGLSTRATDWLKKHI
jgi:hypothetical protein